MCVLVKYDLDQNLDSETRHPDDVIGNCDEWYQFHCKAELSSAEELYTEIEKLCAKQKSKVLNRRDICPTGYNIC